MPADLLTTLAPVFLIILLGASLYRLGLFPAEASRWSSRLTYVVALPALLFIDMAKAQIALVDSFDLVAVLLLASLVSVIAGYACGWVLGLPPGSTGALAHTGFRGNLAFIGLPVISYSSSGSEATLAVFALAAMIPFYNVGAVAMLLGDQNSVNRGHPRSALVRLSVNPLILACCAGFAVAWLGLQVPKALMRTLEPLAGMALPLALLSIGATLNFQLLQRAFAPSLLASLIKIGLTPAAGFSLGYLIGLSREEMFVALIMLACPTASASLILASEMESDTQLTANAIVLSTLLSTIPLALVIAAYR